jgi:hypothetical protein
MLPNDFPIPTSKIDAMISLELEFSQFLYDSGKKRDQILINLTLKELTNITSFNFTELLKDYLLKEFTELNITESEPILVNELNYIINVSNLYLNASKYNPETSKLNDMVICQRHNSLFAETISRCSTGF